jgi:Holliday junction resolvase RusA-like endonuclease
MRMDAMPSYADPPFAVAPDIVLDLPPPVSVNELRKVYYPKGPKANAWREMADRFLLVAKSRNEVRFDRIPHFEVRLVLSEQHNKIDLDNGVKIVIDYLRRREIIQNDAPKNLRRLVVEWGHAPAGCRVTVTPLETSR